MALASNEIEQSAAPQFEDSNPREVVGRTIEATKKIVGALTTVFAKVAGDILGMFRR